MVFDELLSSPGQPFNVEIKAKNQLVTQYVIYFNNLQKCSLIKKSH
jgi:hypothetical protein